MKTVATPHLRDLIGETLTLKQPSVWKREHELRRGEEVVGSLRFTSFFSDVAEVECADGAWTIQGKGFWKPVLSVTPRGEETPVFSTPLERFRSTQTFKLPKYRTLTLTQNIWATKYELRAPMQQLLLTVNVKTFSFGTISITLERKAEAFEELPWILFLVCVKVLRDQQSKRGAH